MSIEHNAQFGRRGIICGSTRLELLVARTTNSQHGPVVANDQHLSFLHALSVAQAKGQSQTCEKQTAPVPTILERMFAVKNDLAKLEAAVREIMSEDVPGMAGVAERLNEAIENLQTDIELYSKTTSVQ